MLQEREQDNGSGSVNESPYPSVETDREDLQRSHTDGGGNKLIDSLYNKGGVPLPRRLRDNLATNALCKTRS